MSAPQRVQVLMCAWRAWRGLGWVFCSCRIHSGVPGGGVGSWSRRSGCFLADFRAMVGLSGCAEKLCHWVFYLVGGFSVTQVTQGSICIAVTGVCVCACVCHLLVKVVSLVSLIYGLTWKNPSDTRVKSCVTLCHFVSLPNVRIFELQTAEHAPAAVCCARCVSADQHPVHLQLGGERPALDRLQPFLRTPDVVCLA